MRLNLILLFMVVVLGVGISFVLIPRDKDVALLKLRNDETDEARQVLLDKYDQGDRSVAVIASLAEIAISEGEIPIAVELLERYVRENPKDISGKRRLAEYYRFNQQRDKYLRTLAEVVAQAGTDAERRLLADLYRVRGNYDALLPALGDLIERNLASHPQHLEAAQLAAAVQDYDQTMAILQKMWRSFDFSLDASSVGLFVMVADRAGKRDEAADVVGRLAAGERGPVAVVPVINEVFDRGQSSLGLKLLSQFEGDMHKTPPLLIAWARMQIALDQETVALERLLALEQSGDLPELAFPVLLDLAILSTDIDLVELLLAERDMGKLGGFRLRSVADAAVYRRRNTLLQQFMDQAPERFKQRHPALLSEVLIGLGQLDAARAEAERARRQDDPRLDQLMRLARAELKLDQQERAAATLQRIAAHPDLDGSNMEALAQLYIQTERTREGLAAFTRLRRDRPSLSAEYGWARMAAKEGREKELLAWFNTRSGLDKDLLSDIVFLSLGLAPRSGLEAARRLYSEHPGRESRRLYADALIANGRYGEALPIIEELLPGNDEEAETYVSALVAANRKDEALQFLLERSAGQPLPVLIADDLMALAIELDQPKLAYDEARRQPELRKFDDDTIASLAENAAEDGDFELVDLIVEQVGPALLQARPVMAARIELARGNDKLAREWAEKALQVSNLRNADVLDLAKVFGDLGEVEQSLTLLEGLADDPDTPAFAMADLAAQYLQLGKAKQGLPVMRRLMQRRDEAQVQEGWARLETKAGEPAAVLGWLKAVENPTRQVLADLYYMADARDARALAFEASTQIFNRYPGDEARLIRGLALTKAGRGKEAVPILQPLLPGGPEIRAAYVAALGQGGNAKDLTAFAREALKDPDLDPQLRSAILFALLEAGEAELALPQLRELARQDPKQWEPAYLDALRKAGATQERVALIERKLRAGPATKQRDALLFELLEVGGPDVALPWLKRAAEAEPESEWPATYETALAKAGRNDSLIAWLSERAENRGLPVKARRAAGFRLLDLNARDAAERAFLDLARAAGPKSPDAQQLLFLWGPRPPKRGLDWLTEKGRAASPADRAGWMQLLLDVQAHERVIALGMDNVPVSAADPALKPLAQALIAARQREEVGLIIDPLIPETADPKQLLQLADWAEQAQQRDTAIRAYRRALAFIGDDAAALLKAGRAFTFASRPELARDTLQRYFRAAGPAEADDHRPYYYYGLALAQMRRTEEAREAYAEMLRRLDRNGAEDFESRRMRATAYEAIGDGERAISVYEGLMAERPTDRSLVADFASLLIELRRYERAELLLGQN